MAVLAVHDGPQTDLYVKLYPLHDLFVEFSDRARASVVCLGTTMLC